MTMVEVEIETDQRKIKELQVRERLAIAIERLAPAAVAQVAVIEAVDDGADIPF